MAAFSAGKLTQQERVRQQESMRQQAEQERRQAEATRTIRITHEGSSDYYYAREIAEKLAKTTAQNNASAECTERGGRLGNVVFSGYHQCQACGSDKDNLSARSPRRPGNAISRTSALMPDNEKVGVRKNAQTVIPS